MKTTTLILALSITSLSYSQSIISIETGYAKPTGDYSSTDVKNKNSGYSLGGEYLKGSFGYMFNKTIGAQATINYQSTGIDYKSYAKGVNYSIADQHVDYVYDNNSVLTMPKIKYNSISVMAGVILNYDLNENSSFGGKLNVGESYLSIPHLDIDIVNKYPFEQHITITSPVSSVSGLCVMPEIYYTRTLNDHVSCSVNIGYFYSNMKGGNSNITYTESGTTPWSTYSFTRTIVSTNNIVNTSVLVGVSLQYKF